MTLRRNTSAFVAVTVMQRGAVPMLQVMCAAMSCWRVRGRMGMSGRCAELMRWSFEGAFRSSISPAFCRFSSPSVALNILFSGGEAQDVCAVWRSKADFFRRGLEGHFRGLRGKGMAVFGGDEWERVGAVFLEVVVADALRWSGVFAGRGGIGRMERVFYIFV